MKYWNLVMDNYPDEEDLIQSFIIIRPLLKFLKFWGWGPEVFFRFEILVPGSIMLKDLGLEGDCIFLGVPRIWKLIGQKESAQQIGDTGIFGEDPNT